MLYSSKDVFWIVFSFVTLWVGICVGFGCFYLALLLRDFQKVTASIKKKIELIDSILNLVKKKVENTASYVPPLIEGIEKIVEAVKEKKRSDDAKEVKKSAKKKK